MRRALTVTVNGVRVLGTEHVAVRMSGTQAVLILNCGDLRRAGPADVGARLADRMATAGYRVFRFDMPGIGDTAGAMPEHQETYWRHVELGGQVPWLSGLMDHLKLEMGIKQFILCGMCGGAVSSIYLAEERPGDVSGLVLIEPSVILDAGPEWDLLPQEPATRQRIVKCEMKRAVAMSKAAVTQSKAFGKAWTLYGKLRRRSAARAPSPGRAASGELLNVMLLESWGRVQQAGIPMLVLLAPGAHRKTIRETAFRSGVRESTTIVELDRTNHLLLMGGGQQRAIGEIEKWLGFPIGAAVAPRREANAA